MLRCFAGIDLGRAPAPDETTMLNFGHLLEEHDRCGQMLDAVNLYLVSRGIRIATGTIVDAPIIHAPSSTKKEKKERAPAMHEAAPAAQDMTSRRVKTKAGVDEAEKRKNRTKARVRAKVEWPLRELKRVFGLTKVCYRGLKKNREWLCAGFALVSVYRNRKRRRKIKQRLVPQAA